MQKARNPPIPDPEVDPVKLEAGLHWDPWAWNVSDILEWIKENTSVPKQPRSLFSFLLADRIFSLGVSVRYEQFSFVSALGHT